MTASRLGWQALAVMCLAISMRALAASPAPSPAAKTMASPPFPPLPPPSPSPSPKPPAPPAPPPSPPKPPLPPSPPASPPPPPPATYGLPKPCTWLNGTTTQPTAVLSNGQFTFSASGRCLASATYINAAEAAAAKVNVVPTQSATLITTIYLTNVAACALHAGNATACAADLLHACVVSGSSCQVAPGYSYYLYSCPSSWIQNNYACQTANLGSPASCSNVKDISGAPVACTYKPWPTFADPLYARFPCVSKVLGHYATAAIAYQTLSAQLNAMIAPSTQGAAENAWGSCKASLAFYNLFNDLYSTCGPSKKTQAACTASKSCAWNNKAKTCTLVNAYIELGGGASSVLGTQFQKCFYNANSTTEAGCNGQQTPYSMAG